MTDIRLTFSPAADRHELERDSLHAYNIKHTQVDTNYGVQRLLTDSAVHSPDAG